LAIGHVERRASDLLGKNTIEPSSLSELQKVATVRWRLAEIEKLRFPRNAKTQDLQLLTNFDNLQFLELSGTPLYPDSQNDSLRSTLRETYSDLPINSLVLHKTPVNSEVIQMIGEDFKTLSVLRLRTCENFDDNALKSLAESRNQDLIELELNSCPITSTSWEHLAKLSKLEKLQINHCNQLTSPTRALMNGRPENSANKNGIELLSKLKNLETLDLSACEKLNFGSIGDVLPRWEKKSITIAIGEWKIVPRSTPLQSQLDDIGNQTQENGITNN